MKYLIAEKFRSIQGEGLYAGTPMAFIRFVGCSVGKKICQHCDTDFEVAHAWRGGGEFTAQELLNWTFPYTHICLTGGEPLDQDLSALFDATSDRPTFHIETSGTKEIVGLRMGADKLWICVSPKPGFIEEVVMQADEIKVIVPGLGNGSGWPQLTDARRWAEEGKLVYLQPRNGKFDIDQVNLKYVQDLLVDFPQLRLSTQMHKILKVQ